MKEIINIVGDYLVPQQDDPNFDPSAAMYFLYDELVSLHESNL